MEQREPRYECRTCTLGEIMDMGIREPRFLGKRGFTWTIEQKRTFLSNCLDGHYPGATMIAREPEKGDYYMLDFTQRYRTLQEYVEDPSQFFLSREEVEGRLRGIFSNLMPGETDKNIANKVRIFIDICMQYGEIGYDNAVKGLLLAADGDDRTKIRKTLRDDTIRNWVRKIRENLYDLRDMEIPTVMFSSIDDAVYNYIQINTNQHDLRDYDLWRARWNNCEIDIAPCRNYSKIRSALERYYTDIQRKVRQQQESWEQKREKAGQQGEEALLYETLLDKETSDEQDGYSAPVRNFAYTADCITMDSEGHIYITLYELCCALAYIFYETVPQFKIPATVKIKTHEWKTSYLGYIFLSDIFSIPCINGPYAVEEMASYTDALNHHDFLDDMIDKIIVESIAFRDSYNALVFAKAAPSRFTFTPFISISFYHLWHTHYEMVDISGNGEQYEIRVREDLDSYNRIQKLIPVLLFKMIIESFLKYDTGNIRKNHYSIQYYLVPVDNKYSVSVRRSRLSTGILRDFVEDMLDWDDIPEKIRHIIELRKTDMRSWTTYNNQDFWVLYSIFTALFMTGTQNTYEQSSIFESSIIREAYRKSHTMRNSLTEFGNMFYYPKDADRLGIKETASLRKQIGKLSSLLTEKQLNDLYYPADDASKRSFNYIRSNLLKKRPKAYAAFIEERERYIWNTLEEAMHRIAEYEK